LDVERQSGSELVIQFVGGGEFDFSGFASVGIDVKGVSLQFSPYRDDQYSASGSVWYKCIEVPDYSA
jgi:hypothetical protein